MPISDLLWACPLCGLEAGLRSADGRATCAGCGAVFRRVDGARIAARRADGGEEVRSASAWFDALPDLVVRDPLAPIAPQRAVVRVGIAGGALHFRRRFIGRAERFGPRMPGRIALHPDGLVFEPDRGDPIRWPLVHITAVQPTSSALQIKARGMPVASIRFLETSVRFWEYQLHERIRARFRAEGRGEIVEFQPRICTR